MVSKPVHKQYTKPTKRAHRKLPNGFGSITEIKGRYLRNPFFVRICVGKTETGRPILRSLKPKAYFKTYNEAYEALVEYNKSPYDLDQSMTVQNLYDRWSPVYFEQVSESSKRAIRASWKKCQSVYDIQVRELKAGNIHEIIDAEPSAQMKMRIKMLFDMMLDYAMEYEIVDHNVSRSFKLPKNIASAANTVTSPHIALAIEEIKRLWDLVNEPYVDMMLIQCYTGLRPQELLNIRMENVHFEQSYFTGGLKTAAGKNRIVPIHEKIKPLFKKRLNVSEWLFQINGKPISSHTYRDHFEQILPGHRPHDARKTFATYAAKSGMDEVAIKRIMGHQLDLTESVYTERSTEWLVTQMNKLDIQF